jgi:site-specific recombinase XerC
LDAGLRISEALSVRVRDVRVVDGVAKSVRVIGKGNRERLMPLPEAFGQVFGYWLSDKANARKSPYGYSFATTPAIRSSLTCV